MTGMINFCNITKATTVQEDVLLTLGVLIGRAPKHVVLSQLPTLMPILITFFQDIRDISLCTTTSSVLGDICYSVGQGLEPYANNVISTILKYLMDEDLDMQFEVSVVELFGDMALALGPLFRPFLKPALEVLKTVTSIKPEEEEDDDLFDLVDQIVAAGLGVYTSIIQGLYSEEVKINDDYMIWKDHIPYLMSLIERLSENDRHREEITRAVCGLVGDVRNAFKEIIHPSQIKPIISKLAQKAKSSTDPKTSSVGQWLEKMV
ncbi:Importin subunit beta-1 [Thelohanellus kitauei]|uniref:Importin subunit beta-1 n=1 Tax=Thelohanellus kitauei TaxID=669202 RepID=A0A0C2MLN4_THEKT|nr:Importin subunit beta-1 [Thelohanellus kitauei]